MGNVNTNLAPRLSIDPQLSPPGVTHQSGASVGTIVGGEYEIDVANRVLDSFSRSRIDRRHGGWYVVWVSCGGHKVSRRWQCRGGQDFYPTWHRQWSGGGTASTALSQLIRWLRGQPVLPVVSWRYWASDTCKLLPLEASTWLLDGGYPEHANCVLCGQQLNRGLDWWNLDGVSGPCCDMNHGCKQKSRP